MQDNHFIVYAVLIVIILFLMNSILIKQTSNLKGSSTAPAWTVYGTNGCGWTRKQLQVMDSAKISYTFVDCDKEECAGMTGFPTLIDSEGVKTTGFKNF